MRKTEGKRHLNSGPDPLTQRVSLLQFRPRRLNGGLKSPLSVQIFRPQSWTPTHVAHALPSQRHWRMAVSAFASCRSASFTF